MSLDPLVWVNALLIIFTLSFIYKESPLFHFCETLAVGAMASNMAIQAISSIQSTAYSPLSQGAIHWIIPMILGVMLFAGLFPKYSWLTRYPVALYTGIGTGTALRVTLQADVIRQIIATAQPLVVTGDAYATFNQIFIAAAVLSVLIYFIFTVERNVVTRPISVYARHVMMLAFGTVFANAIMGRVGLISGPLKYLLMTWLQIA
jgi:hypothetical protein